MIISYGWLSEYLPRPIPVSELSTILTSIGLEVEAVEKMETVKGGLEGLVIGEVLTANQHPNADKLKITTVSVGGETPLKIVCGAPNVAAGQKVVVAVVGTTVHPTTGEPFLIKKAKIRGEESEGMICAEDEIGLGDSHAGIMVLPADAKVGTPAKEYFKIGEADHAIHIGLTPNRADAASHLGVARDVCAYLTHHSGQATSAVRPEIKKIEKSSDLPISVKVEDAEDCPRYMGLVMENIHVGPSPEWLQQRLQTIGIRSINNVVDITNYILHTYGQPLHAFDYDKISDHTVIVKTLPEGSTFITLDDKERKLLATDLMICDTNGGMCIAGVFGGANSGITDSTTRIFLESAFFAPKAIRRTSMHHGLRTDAATHFEKGVDIANLEPALLHAAQLISEIAGGNVASDVVDVAAPMSSQPTIVLKYDYLRKLSGKSYPNEAVKGILSALGFMIASEDQSTLTVTVPTYKQDVTGPADIVEEILRIDGLDAIAIPERLNISLLPASKNDRSLRDKVSSILYGEGFSEIVTNSITNSKYYEGQEALVKMLNSLSSELDVLRPSMLESGLEVLSYNINRKNANLLFFDFGNIYAEAVPHQYNQSSRLALYSTGNLQSKTWNTAASPADLYFLKGVINNICKSCGISGIRWVPADGAVQLTARGKVLVSVKQVPAQKLQQFDIKQPIYYADIDWDAMYAYASDAKIKFTEVARFPVVQRDLAMVVDKSVRYETLEQATNSLKLAPLQEFLLFDVFESEKLGKDKKSLAVSYSFNLPDRTLTDAETDAMMQQIRKVYEQSFGAQIRS